MIVTLNLALYFVCYVWNTYISQHIHMLTDRATNESSRSLRSNNDNSPNSDSNNQANTKNNVNSNKAGEISEDGNKNTNSPDQVNQNPSGEDNLPKSDSNNQDNPTKNIDSNKASKIYGDGNTNNSSPYQDNPNTSGETDINKVQENSEKVKEGSGDFHPCFPLSFSEDEDKGRELIYNAEPEYGCICTENKIQFFPPVYIQRYMEIDRILKESCWSKTVKKVVDFGCAELSFEMRYLKKLYGIEEIVAVDIDLDTLERNSCKVDPCPTDYLKKRPTPLSVKVYVGSVAHTHDSLSDADAVIAIELIEHLFPHELECLPFTIFGFIKPKIAIFTTPNADFNVLLTGLVGFRHPDHKFEWSQQQFEDWGYNLVQRYPNYRVTFKGIGPGPEGSAKYGCCSQMATFIKISESSIISDDDLHVQDGPYTLIKENVFPFFKDERTEEEKITDAAEYFITNCKMRSRVYDELKSEIPIKAVMGRLNYYDKEKLIEILTSRSWEIKMNASGEEVVTFPDSEEEDSEPEPNEYITDEFENFDKGDCTNPPVEEENWDSYMDSTLTNDQEYSRRETTGDHVNDSDKIYHNVDIVNTKDNFIDSTNIEELEISDRLKLNSSEKCSTSETNVPDIELSEKLNSSQIESFPEKDTNLNFEESIYETPYNNGFSKCLESPCDCSLPLSDKITKGCKRSLAMEFLNGSSQSEANPPSEDPFCCLSTVSSSCDTSIYATPCYSQRHVNNIPKCLSLQQISTHCGSPALTTELGTTLKEGMLVRDRKDKFSKSMEGFKSLESDLTCSSTSRVIDSGYPDSYSEYNMDMDLTPEQIDDIETESEENDVSSRSLSPPPPAPQIPWLVDDVQNGDVANNNRDGEGNNLVADMEEDPMEFEARIDEINNDVLNLAAANDAINFSHNSGEPYQDLSGDCFPYVSDTSLMSDMTNDHLRMFERSPTSDSLKLKSFFTESNTEILLGESFCKQRLRNSKSESSIATNYSGILEPYKSKMDSKSEVIHHSKLLTPKFKTHNSLTTVLDGHSKFSNCSLVRAVEVYQVTGLENDSPEPLSKSIPSGSREPAPQAGTSDVQPNASLTSTGLQDDRQSLVSVYQSAESLNNVRGLQTEDHNQSSFPDWLLNILVSDIAEDEVESVNSVQSVWDSDSLEERVELDFDVQVDTRGGGDPQRDTWQR